MAAIASLPSNPPDGVASKLPPTPILLAIVGGGVGLVVFLMRKNSAPAADSTNSTLLPNTAIMLGSLQQGVLDLKGQVGQSAIDTQTIMAGNQFSLTDQIAALTAGMQTGLANAQAALLAAGATNTDAITAGLKLQGDSLSKLISDSAGAQAAYNTTFSAALASGLDTIVAQHNAETAGLNALGIQVANVGNQVQGVQSQVTGVASQVAGVAGQQGTQLTALQYTDWGNAYQGLATNTALTAPAGKNDPRVLDWLKRSQNMFARAVGSALPYPEAG
jgi:hypothetical protein